MQAEIQKAVEAGKLTPHAGQALATLQPGSYCLHKSWGFGRIEAIDFLLGQVTIDFKGKKGHSMQLQYAAESLTPIAPGHILAQKAANLEGVKTLAKEDPVGLTRSILQSFGGKATQEQIAQSLLGDVFTDAEWKRWWEATKKLLKRDGHFGIPAKKKDPVVLREAAVSRGEELLERFAAARQLKDQLAALDQIIKNIDAFSDPAQLQPVITAVENAAAKNQKLHTAEAFELALARDEICEKSGLQPGAAAITLAQLLRDEERRLPDILPDTPAAKHRRVLAEFPAAFGDRWPAAALALMLQSNVRIVSELARLLQEQGRHEELRRELDRWIRDHSITTEILYWLCKERGGEFADLVRPEVFSAILSALERDQFSTVKRGGKLHDLLMDDRELIPDLLAGADSSAVRDAMRKLMLTTVFEELDKRSLLGRIVRVYPEMGALLGGEAEQKQEALIVSWESLEKRKAELDELENKKIPENIREIQIAREYGDLRENFEFKAAKEMQRVLQRRKAEMGRDLSRARGTNFENADTAQVSIGTVVTLRNPAGGETQVYSILGAWDSAPERGVISYLSGIGQALLGHGPGEQIDLPTEHGTEKVEIVSIAPFRPAAGAGAGAGAAAAAASAAQAG